MTKTEIFDDIVSVVKVDASFCKDKRGGDESKYRALISEDMGDDMFVRVICTYLATFECPGHLSFYNKGRSLRAGIEVRRYGDELYVTRSFIDEIKVGDRIVALDGLALPQAAKKYEELLYGETEDRQGQYWAKIIAYSKEVTVVSGDKKFIYPVRTDVKVTYRQPYEFKMIDGVAYLRFDDFIDEKGICELLSNNKQQIESDCLIIDVRENIGGTDTAWLPLLKYCIAEDEDINSSAMDDNDEVNYTERNVDIRLKVLKEYREKANPETKQHFDLVIQDLINHRGMGFVKMADNSEPQKFEGSAIPKMVFVLSDCTCASSGESFIMAIKGLKKVTVIGRPTMGILDYSNLAYVDYGAYVLNYPTSRSLSVDSGNGINKKGVGVDYFIPWTPEFLHNDIDLQIALNMAKDNRNK
ncbi:MAG: hypothetical protein J1F36_05460 [Clostridiales bacterium]|nr:hypothetical protein [Clostridiales bacterium]